MHWTLHTHFTVCIDNDSTLTSPIAHDYPELRTATFIGSRMARVAQNPPRGMDDRVPRTQNSKRKANCIKRGLVSVERYLPNCVGS